MTEKTKHTRGPWIAATYSLAVGAPIVSTTGRPVGRVTYFELDDVFDNHRRESEANGRLMAASPDLLDACKKLVHDYGRRFGDEDTLMNRDLQPRAIAAAMDAIAKAEG